MSLRSQRRLAARILKVGDERLWIDPDETERVSSAITGDEIRKLIHEGTIRAMPVSGTSRGRNRSLREDRKRGRRRGLGSRKGGKHSKKVWARRIRVIRSRLADLRDRSLIPTGTYRNLLLMAKGGMFRSVSHLNEYAEAHKLVRRR